MEETATGLVETAEKTGGHCIADKSGRWSSTNPDGAVIFVQNAEKSFDILSNIFFFTRSSFEIFLHTIIEKENSFLSPNFHGGYFWNHSLLVIHHYLFKLRGCHPAVLFAFQNRSKFGIL